MAAEWRESTVGAEVEILLGFAFKSVEFATEPPGHRLVRGDNVKRGAIEWGDKVRYWRDLTPDLDKYRLQPGDVVVGMDGSRVGENFARISREDLPALLVQRVACLRGGRDLDQAFLRYLICSPGFTAYIKAVHTGTSIPHISGSQIGAYPIPVPPRDEQRAIAHILGTLDDKIELNRRMNETLEALARAIFKSWFVDFEPVRAKMDGRRPLGIGDETAALFPDRLQESAIGEIPAGWRSSTFGEVATNPRRSVQPSEIQPATPYVALEHMPRRSIALDSWDDASIVESNKSRFERKEILFGKLRPYFHKVGVAPTGGVCSTDILVVAPKGRGWFGFVLGHASSDEMIQHADASSTGTKMPRTNWGDLARFSIALPPDHVATEFSKVVEPLVDRILAGICESRTLTLLRDVLLPKLLSGELRISDAEKTVEAAT